MKRSEAIKIITKCIRSWNGAYYDESLESYILSELEDAGVAPPLIEAQKKKFLYMDICPDTGHDYEVYDYIPHTVRAWESEDV